MAIPAYPILTGDEERDAELLAGYKTLCIENILEGDLAHLPDGFPPDHIPEALRPEGKKE
jgi:hypothetical protein